MITNGFDPDNLRTSKIPKKKDKLILGYFGGIEKPAFGYKNFFAGYQKAITLGGNFSFQSWGLVSKKLKDSISGNYTLSNHVTFNGYISHYSCMKKLADVDVLILLLNKHYEHIVPQKLYHYLSLRKPIMAIIPSEGCAARIIENTNSGILISPDNIDEISHSLIEVFKKWEKGTLKASVNERALQNYRYDILTGKLVEIFKSVIEK